MTEFEKEQLTFLDHINNAPSLWQALDLRYMAVDINGQWHNLATRCYLDHRLPEDVTRFENLPELARFRAGQMVLPFSDLERLLVSVGGGELTLPDIGSLTYRNQEADQKVEGKRYSHIWSGYQTISDFVPHAGPASHGPPYIHWSAEVFQAYGTRMAELLWQAEPARGDIDQKLRTLSNPIDGVESVARFVLAQPNPLDPDAMAGFQLFAPYEAALEPQQCRVSGEDILAGIRVGNERVIPAVKLGVFLWGALGVPTSFTERLPSGGWNSDGGQLTIRHRFKVGPCAGATLLLRVGHRCVYRLELRTHAPWQENERLQAYVACDPDMEEFQASIDGGGSKKSRAFERAVGRLFHFLGFSTDTLACESRLTDAVDVVAFAPDQELCLAIECTVGSIDSGGKLGKLVARTMALRESMRGSVVHPVLATSLKRSQIADGELSKAAEDGIVVLAKEDIDHLVNVATQSERASTEAVTFLVSKKLAQGKQDAFRRP